MSNLWSLEQPSCGQSFDKELICRLKKLVRFESKRLLTWQYQNTLKRTSLSPSHQIRKSSKKLSTIDILRNYFETTRDVMSPRALTSVVPNRSQFIWCQTHVTFWHQGPSFCVKNREKYCRD